MKILGWFTAAVLLLVFQNCSPMQFSAHEASTDIDVLGKENGVCGTSHTQQLTSAPTTNLCLVGTASAVAGSGPWNWSCAGKSGGQSVSCSAYRPEVVPPGSCPTLPGVTTQAWTGSVTGYKKTQKVRQGSTCSGSQFTCQNGVIYLNGSVFNLSASNPDFQNYTSDNRGCVQVPRVTCSMSYTYSAAGTTVHWSVSNKSSEYIDATRSGWSCAYGGQTSQGPLSDIINVSQAGPVDASLGLQCSLRIQDVLGAVETCGGHQSLWCSVSAKSLPSGNPDLRWNLGGYSLGSYTLTTNGSVGAPVSLPPAPLQGGTTELAPGVYRLVANINSPEGFLQCEASTGVACGGTAPLYNGEVATGQTRNIVANPNSPGQCQCEGGLVFDPTLRRCQKACPAGMHFNDRNGVLTCDSCKDAVITAINGENRVAGVLLNANMGAICVYPGYKNDDYYDPNSGSMCGYKMYLPGWPTSVPTAANFNANSYPGPQDGTVCNFAGLNVAEKAYMLNCQKVTTRAGACTGAVGGGGDSGSATGGGIIQQGY